MRASAHQLATYSQPLLHSALQTPPLLIPTNGHTVVDHQRNHQRSPPHFNDFSAMLTKVGPCFPDISSGHWELSEKSQLWSLSSEGEIQYRINQHPRRNLIKNIVDAPV